MAKVVDQDLIDTAPVVDRSDARVASKTEILQPGERAEIVLDLPVPATYPALFLRSSGSPARVDAVVLGSLEIFEDGTSVEDCRMGRTVPGTVSQDRPLKVVLVGLGPDESTVTASLVPPSPPADGTYRLGRGEIGE